MTAWLVDTLLATSLLMALVLIVREPVRKQFGATVAYGLWLIPAVRLLMPTLTTTVERAAAPVGEPSTTAMPIYAAALAPPVSAPVELSLVERLGGLNSVLFAIWLSGAAAMIFRAFLIYRRQRRAVLDDSVQLAHLGGIRIIRSGAVGGPLAFGIFDRVIALPMDFDERFAAPQRRLALDHELAHHRSGDILANHLAYGLLCLQWFNPLAWASHSAFRFDQEAACDARVLDKADSSDRAAYGQAIAKAASGRALLFAGALDRPTTLRRRLRAMLTSPSPTRRLSGKALVAITAAAALPLTATWATLYVDVPAPVAPVESVAPVAPVAPVASVAPIAPVAQVQAVAGVAPVAPVAAVPPAKAEHYNGQLNIRGDMVTINGRTKHIDRLTPAEKQQVRRDIARAKAEIANSRIDSAEIERDIREAMAEFKFDKEELRRNLGESRVEIAEAMRQIDRHSAELRRSGRDPERIKAQVRASLEAVDSIDIDEVARKAIASVDAAGIAASVRAAEASLTKARAEIERLEERLEDN